MTTQDPVTPDTPTSASGVSPNGNPRSNDPAEQPQTPATTAIAQPHGNPSTPDNAQPTTVGKSDMSEKATDTGVAKHDMSNILTPVEPGSKRLDSPEAEHLAQRLGKLIPDSYGTAYRAVFPNCGLSNENAALRVYKFLDVPENRARVVWLRRQACAAEMIGADQRAALLSRMAATLLDADVETLAEAASRGKLSKHRHKRAVSEVSRNATTGEVDKVKLRPYSDAIAAIQELNRMESGHYNNGLVDPPELRAAVAGAMGALVAGRLQAGGDATRQTITSADDIIEVAPVTPSALPDSSSDVA